MNSAEGFSLIITLWRHKKSLKLVYAKTLSAKTLKLVLAINSNLKVAYGMETEPIYLRLLRGLCPSCLFHCDHG